MNQIIDYIMNFFYKVRFFLYQKLCPKKLYKESPTQRQGMKVVFENVFDTPIDYSIWTNLLDGYLYYHPAYTVQYYDKSCIQVKDGYLHLYTKYQPKDFQQQDGTTISIPYAVGMLNSCISTDVKFQYGYFEIRSKNPSQPAVWPAFWLSGSQSWPPEIDIFEMYGGKNGKNIDAQDMTIHWGVNGQKLYSSMTKVKVNNSDKDFHIYACDWTEKHIKFYTDGVLISQFTRTKILDKWFNQKMIIIMNNAIDEKYMNNFDNNIVADFTIDYIRIFQKI